MEGQQVINLHHFEKGGVRRLQCPEGFVYRFDKPLSNGSLEGWRCCMGRNCPGRIRVFANTTLGVVFNANHRHEPSGTPSASVPLAAPPKRSRTEETPPQVVFLTESVSTKGNRLLGYNGHKYRFDKAHTRGPFESWRCVGGRNCPGRLKVRVGTLEATVTKDEHMHDSCDSRVSALDLLLDWGGAWTWKKVLRSQDLNQVI
uniref:FLYWCH-type domain-containing protein n=1 Tax=Steinernema glaseri TaxID=37863 RepID=A0A1I7Z7Q8_9BILA